jgi:outer membrane protein assembly factor BamB
MCSPNGAITRRDLLRGAEVGAVVAIAGCTSTLGCRSSGSIQPDHEPWPGFRFDAANTGYSSSAVGPTDSVCRMWRFRTDREVSSPAVVDGVVYVGTRDGVHALNANNGRERWRFETDRWVESSPTVVEGIVYISVRDGTVVAINSVDGTVLWSTEVARPNRLNTSPTVADGIVYVCSDFSWLTALDAADGSKRWEFNGGFAFAGMPRYPSPSVADGIVYAGIGYDGFHAVDAEDGTGRWQFEADGPIRSAPAVRDGVAYVCSDDGRVYAVNAADGTERWYFDTGYAMYASPAVTNTAVYVSANDGPYALKIGDGTVLWHVDNDGMLSSRTSVFSQPTVANKTVYVGGLALDTKDGTIQFRVEELRSSSAVVGGTLFASPQRNSLVAFRERRTPI